MGGCLSTEGGCGQTGHLKSRLSMRRRRIKRRLGSKDKRVLGYDKVSKDFSEDSRHFDLESPVPGSDTWLEPNPLYESDSGSEDEYHSAPDLLLNDSEDLSSDEYLLPKDYTSDKRSSGTSSPSANMKRVSPDPFISFGNQSSSLFFSSMLMKPVAGTQFPVCPKGKEMFDSWSPIEPNTFRERGMNYLRYKKKEHASSKAAYYPFGVDVYLSHHKINHIARLVELPSISSTSTLPAILIVNVQIPLYAPPFFNDENDGEGMNVVMYFKLLENFEKELPLHFQESIKRLIDNETEKVKGLPIDTTIPFHERLKILNRMVNVDDLQLSVTQRKVMHDFNEKHILSQPQHEFYSGENYIEIDMDMHRFSYLFRKGLDVFLDKLKICILDVGLAIQGNKSEELPDMVLCCIRINGIDHSKYRYLETE